MSTTKKGLSEAKMSKLLLEGSIDWDTFKEYVDENFTKDASKLLKKSAKIRLDTLEARKNSPPVQDIYVRCIEQGTRIYETILHNGIPTFLYFDSKEGLGWEDRWGTAPVLHNATKVYHPMHSTPYRQYVINPEEIKKENIKDLGHYHNEILGFMRRFLYLPEQSYSLLSAFIMETHIQNKAHTTGYLFFEGLPDVGKTQVGEVIEALGYRPYLALELNCANVYDFIGAENYGDCTLIIDEIQELASKNKFGADALLTILRSGYKRTGRVRRILDASSASGRTFRYYNTFCCKAFLGYYLPSDAALKTRTIERQMLSATKEWMKEHTAKITSAGKEASKIRNALLLSRMVHYFDPLPKLDIPFYGRVREVWEGKLLVSYQNRVLYQSILTQAEEYEMQQLELRTQSLEGQLVLVVSALLSEGNRSLPFINIWKGLLIHLNETANLKRDSYESETLDRKISKKGVGHLTKNALAGQKYTDRGVMYRFKMQNIETACGRYNISAEDTLVLYLQLQENHPEWF